MLTVESRNALKRPFLRVVGPAAPRRPSRIYEPPPEAPSTAEPWVDLHAVARHLGFCYGTALKMVHDGAIPFVARPNGARVHRRFQLSAVDAALRKRNGSGPPPDADAA